MEVVDQALIMAKVLHAVAKLRRSTEEGWLQGLVTRIAGLRAQLGGSARERAEIVREATSASRSGLTDLPPWFILAFAEHGWQWGEWHGFSDAMHFDYMGPVADVRS